VVLDTLHPTHEGHAVKWRRNAPEAAFTEYGRTNRGGEAAENWRRSTFYELFHSAETYLRVPLNNETLARYWNPEADHAAGMMELFGVLTRFGPSGSIGDMDCMYSAWYTHLERGFNDREIAAIQRLVPFLAGAIKCVSLGSCSRWSAAERRQRSITVPRTARRSPVVSARPYLTRNPLRPAPAAPCAPARACGTAL
jgi:adenylate cyclase